MKSLGTFGFRGAVAHVQTSGLKAMAHVMCMFSPPGDSRAQRAGVRDLFTHQSLASANPL